MSALEALDPIECAKRVLVARGDVQVAILFGSRARGTGSDSADLDLAVLAPGVDLLKLAAALSVATGVEVDVVSLADGSVPLLDAIVRDGVTLFERQRGAAAQWRATALGDLETDRPWYARMRDSWLKRVAEGGLGR
jgi:predicted nucleotidyltransferase